MLLRVFKWLALEKHYGLEVFADHVRSMEAVASFVIFNAEFKHIEDVAVEDSADNEIVGTLFLVAAYHEKTCIILDASSLDHAGIFHRQEIMCLFHKQLAHISAAHCVKFP